MQGSGPDFLDRARHLVESGALVEANRLVRLALTDVPASAPIMTLAGQIAVRDRVLAAAVRHFTRAALTGEDEDPRPLLNLARAQELAGDHDGAIGTAKRAAGRFPDDPRPGGFIALIEAKAGRFAEAAAWIRPGDVDRLDAAAAMRLGVAMARDDGHRVLAANLLARASGQPSPTLAAALHGFIAVAGDDHPRRFDACRRLLVLEPDALDAMESVAVALGKRRNLVRRAGWLWQACCVQPNDPGRLARAAEFTWEVKWPRHGVAANRLLLRHRPRDSILLHRICDLYALQKTEGVDEAVAWAREAIAEQPDNPALWDNAAVMLKEMGAPDQAADLWLAGLDRLPGQQQLHYNYGLLRYDQDDYEEALSRFRKALLLHPRYVRASNMMGMIWNFRHRFDLADRYMRWAIFSEPTNANALVNYGTVLRATGKYSAAIAVFAKAERDAGSQTTMVAAARFNAGMSKLALGELRDGFKLLESRWETRGFPSPRRNFRQPIWRGPHEHPESRLLAYMEQGMGDEVMMSWYVPFLRRDTARLAVDCDHRLVAVFARTFEDVEFIPRKMRGHPRTQAPDLTHKIPLFHVPQYYVEEVKLLIRDNWDWADRRGSRFPARLTVDPARLDRWKRSLDGRFPGMPRLGLSWRSRHRNRFRDQQYLTVDELAQAIPPGTLAVNLQYEHTAEEAERLSELGQRHGFEFVTPEGVDLTDDLEDVFALLQVCDAAVTPMISLAWMAGAVGCPAYIFRSAPERVIWQQFGTPFVPWAPSLRLFFRNPSERWEPVIQDLRARLTTFLAGRSAA